MKPVVLLRKTSLSTVLLSFKCRKGGEATHLGEKLEPEPLADRVSHGIRHIWKGLAHGFLSTRDGMRFNIPIPSDKYSGVIDAIQGIPGDGVNIFIFSTGKNEEYLTERMALVAHLFEASGGAFRNGYVVCPNPEFRLEKDCERGDQFLVVDITPTRCQIDRFGRKLKVFESTKSVKTASIQPTKGKHCLKLKCPEFKTCQVKKEGSVLILPRIGKKKTLELELMGIDQIKDIPDGYKLTSAQGITADAFKVGKPQVNHRKIFDFLDRALVYPIAYFDVESISSPIPIFNGTTRPNERIVFQFSLHLETAEGEPIAHHQFLPEGNTKDPREAFIEALLDCIPATGVILVYHMAFERGVLRELATSFPVYAKRLLALVPRLVDLESPFSTRIYTDHRFQGSSSLKKVFPVLCPGYPKYSELAIQNGEQASSIYLGYVHGILSKREYQARRKDMLDYCGLDTWSMVGILSHLRNLKGKGDKN